MITADSFCRPYDVSVRGGVRGIAVAAATVLIMCTACDSGGEGDEVADDGPSVQPAPAQTSAGDALTPTASGSESATALLSSPVPVDDADPLEFPDDPDGDSDVDVLACQLLTDDIATSVMSGVAYFETGGHIGGDPFGACSYNDEVAGQFDGVQLSLSRTDTPETWKSELQSSMETQTVTPVTVEDAPAGLGDDGLYVATDDEQTGIDLLYWRSGSIVLLLQVIYVPGGSGKPEAGKMFAAGEHIYQRALALSS